RLHNQIELFEFPKESVQRRGPEANLAVRPFGDLLHDAVTVSRSICDRQQDVENLGLERQLTVDASQLVRHRDQCLTIYFLVYISKHLHQRARRLNDGAAKSFKASSSRASF